MGVGIRRRAVRVAGGCGGRLSEPTDPSGCRFRRRRPDRHPGPLHCRQTRRRIGSAGHRREQTGGWRHRRDTRRAGAAARWLYAAAVHAFRCDQYRGLSRPRLQARRRRPGVADRQILLRAGAGQRDPGGRYAVVRRLCQGTSGRSHLRHGRRRVGAGDHGAAIAKARRRNAQSRSRSAAVSAWCRSWSPGVSIYIRRRRSP